MMPLMIDAYGIEIHAAHPDARTSDPTRFLVIIDSGGVSLARLFLASRKQVEEFDASTTEVSAMTQGCTPVIGAEGPEWDKALLGHSREERRTARIFTLEI